MKTTDFQNKARLLGWTVFTGLIWVFFHLVTSVRNLVALMFGAYDTWTFVLSGAYALSLLVFDVLLLFARSQTADRVLGKYWGVCGVFMAVLLIFWKLGVELPGWVLLLLMVPPYFPLDPLCSLLAERAGWEQTMWMLLLAILHLAYCLWLYHCDKTEEKPAGENDERNG